MSFSIGIVGLPNVGKSTLFKALTKRAVDISNYPFCTISPNIGQVEVPDQRLEKLAEILHPTKKIPTFVEFVDLAGLVRGAHLGEGLGNEFLSHIREVSAIIHLIRAFENENVSHVSGKIDPKTDLEVINLELIFKDLSTVEKQIGPLKKKEKAGLDKVEAKILKILLKLKEVLNQGKLAQTVLLEEEEQNLIQDLNLLTLKPILNVLNISEDQLKDEKLLKNFKDSIVISAKIEEELSEMSEEETKNYFKEYGLGQSGLLKLIAASYQILNLITFYTFQNQILQAWTVLKDTKAPKAAGKIHTDFEKGFIKAEVCSYKDLIKTGSEKEAREKGLIRTEGKDYLVKDGDVIHFRSN